ncbi:MAG TPA: FecR domain-containing protein [Puia sp.]|nr:FecR domain-containing protein [Puia sp.]
MSRYKELLDGYLRDSLSESELQEFFQLVKENDQLPDESMIRGEAFDARHEGLTDKDQRQRMLRAVQQAAGAGARSAGAARELGMDMAGGERSTGMGTTHEWRTDRVRNTGTAILTRRIRRWAGAAAAVVMLALAGVYLLKSRPSEIRKIGKVYKNDVAPGKDGAVLRLADGSRVVLDSAGNGELSQQGGTRVIKKGNGQLVYEVAGGGREVVYNTLTTAKGKQFRMTLPDGTLVWLNSFSSLHYPTRFTGATRPVEVTGEAYFEVAADAARPFIVQTGRQAITVLGTHFNINSYEDEPATRTTLLEGAVRVSNAAGQVTLRPGQQASLGQRDKRISVAEVNAEEAVAWKNGYFHFDNADIQTVMRQLARWYDVEVRYDGVTPAAGGDFKGDIGRGLTLAQVLKVLEQTRVHFRIEEDRRIVIYQ